ncbi:MAG TPA: radical SAM family heme chaperone HemW [Acidimicrobiales bacterium]|nr:radical SAM family heme chaperone HemW [Acidimicrobiales bacterium]
MVAASPAPDRRHGEEFGVYLHVPFCRHRCDYCAFATYADRDHLMARYVDVCVAELVRAREDGELSGATSVFVGGGTPSRLPAEELCRLLSAVPLAEGAEVTVECNPEDASASLFTAYRRAGVNRMSFGVQSTATHVLASLGRRHRPDSVARALALTEEAGFPTFNVDLIFGAAGETDADWDRTLGHVLAAGPPHVSAYALTVEPGTPLAHDPLRHPDDDVQARRYHRAEQVLTGAGLRWEEVSNWALPGHGCRHNRLYWRQGDYLGIGSAAHSHRAGRRWWNLHTPDRYVAAVEAGRTTMAGEEVLTPGQQLFERLALSLRTPEGVPAEALPAVPELDGLVARCGDRKVLTVRGRLLANAVTSLLEVDVPTPAAEVGAPADAA